MTIENPIADILTRIRNASAKFHPQVLVPHSRIKEKIVGILKQEGYIKGFDVVSGEHAPMLRIDLKYLGERRQATRAITALRQVSKPSRRVYVNTCEVPQTLGGLGICILSTSQGVMAGHEAKKRGIGGEVLCEIW